MKLTPCELEVAKIAAQGYSVKEVAARLAKSPRTVVKQLDSVYGKLGIDSNVKLAHYALWHGWIQNRYGIGGANEPQLR